MVGSSAALFALMSLTISSSALFPEILLPRLLKDTVFFHKFSDWCGHITCNDIALPLPLILFMVLT